jgi:hypothetical protein
MKLVIADKPTTEPVLEVRLVASTGGHIQVVGSIIGDKTKQGYVIAEITAGGAVHFSLPGCETLGLTITKTYGK